MFFKNLVHLLLPNMPWGGGLVLQYHLSRGQDLPRTVKNPVARCQGEVPQNDPTE